MTDFPSKHTGEQVDNGVTASLKIKDNASTLAKFGESNGQPILTKEPPITPQNVVPVREIPATPGVWATIVTIPQSEALTGYYADFVENNRYAIKLWNVSAEARNNVQIRCQTIDTTDDAELATATTTTNLTDDLRPYPLWFENVFKVTRRQSLENIQTVISVMLSESPGDVEMGIVSNPPNELSFINPTFTGFEAAARESALLLNTLWDKVEELTAQVEALKE